MDTTSINQSTLDQLNRLLSDSPEGGPLFNADELISAIQPYIIALLVVSIIVGILYIIHLIQKMRVNRAIMESRDILREMNQRQKSETPSSRASGPQQTPPEPPANAESAAS